MNNIYKILIKVVLPLIEAPKRIIFESRRSTINGGCFWIIGISNLPSVHGIVFKLITNPPTQSDQLFFREAEAETPDKVSRHLC